MSTKSKRFSALLLTLAMVLSLFAIAPASATPPDEPIGPAGIPLATGNPVATPKVTGPYFNIVDYGAVSNTDFSAASTLGVTNKAAIQAAIDTAHAAGGGTVVVPSGDFRTYTIHLKDNVTLFLESEDSVIRAARQYSSPKDGGKYDDAEAFFYARLQDQGHSHYKNSLIVAYRAKNVMIAGPGLIDGSWVNPSNGRIVNELQGSDQGAASDRLTGVTADRANKAIALYDSQNVFLQDIRILNGGHFAIIAEGVVNMTVDNVLVDTNRDAFNVDCSQNVTITNSVFNSLTDDAIVLKADFGVGRYMRTENVLIDNCTVSGYDAGSVLYRTFTTDKLVATDACGPTARIKLGTEGTGGFDRVTITNVLFDRSRGLAIEAVDSADATNIVMTDCVMRNISSSPIFIRVGDRSRAPVTGIHTTTSATVPTSPVDMRIRRGNVNDWVLPDMSGTQYADLYPNYPVNRYVPEYSRSNNALNPEGSGSTSVANPTAPLTINNVNLDILQAAGKYNPALQPGDEGYQNPGLFANAVGGFESRIAQVHNVYVGNVEIENVDPRYPITLAGLADGKIYDVTFENINVQYRGGITMQDAVEQRRAGTSWSYEQYMTASSSQSPPWLVNTFFVNTEGLLPRIAWNEAEQKWDDSPYNIPERPREYPEPSNFGILPAWGLWARHVEGLTLNNVNFDYIVPDTRDAIVLDDVKNASIVDCTADGAAPVVTAVTNNYKRPTNLEFVINEPYFSTTVTNLAIEGGNLTQKNVTVNAPEPGTPKDTADTPGLYKFPTYSVSSDTGSARYTFAVPTNDAAYSIPLTVYRPYFKSTSDQTALPGGTVSFDVFVRDPATLSTRDYRIAGHYLNQFAEGDSVALRDITASGALPAGATLEKITPPTLNPAALTPNRAARFTWEVPADQPAGVYPVTFMVTDGLIPVYRTVSIYVGAPTVTSFSPSGGHVSLAADSFTVNFDREMDKTVIGTVSVGSATLSNPVWSWDGTSVTYQMVNEFEARTLYAVIIGGFKDVGGVVMAPFGAEFTSGYSLGTALASIYTPGGGDLDAQLEYILSLKDLSRVMNVRVRFELDTSMLVGSNLEMLRSDFSAMNDGNGIIKWTPKDDGIYEGEFLLMYLGGPDGLTADAATDVAKLIFAAKQYGAATVTLTDLLVTGLDEDGFGVTLDSAIEQGEATAIVAKVYSKYDLNKDGVIDERDLAMAQRYYMAKEGDANWAAAQACDFNGDKLVDMLDLVALFANFT